MVMLSHVPPKLWILLAWFTERQTAASAVDSAESRPSGRPADYKRTTDNTMRMTVHKVIRWVPT
jgi:hypothetical protein